MNSEEAYKTTYEKALEYRRIYLSKALEAETTDYVRGFGGPFISEEEYEEKILPFWEKYGRRPKKLWFDCFGSRDRSIDPRIVPADLHFTEILPYINNLSLRDATADKCAFDRFLPEIRQPETVCKCIAGFYYDADMNLINRAEAIKLCLGHEGGLILKPSISTGTSRNVHSADPSASSVKDVEALFDLLGANFIVQGRIEQHPDLARLNPDAVNTIRVNSLLTEQGVYIPSADIRVGAPGQQVVSRGSGGWSCEIKEDNTLHEKALASDIFGFENEAGEKCVRRVMRWKDIPGCFGAGSGYEIPFMDRVRDAVRTAHKMLPHFRWIGWDFTVNKSGEPVLIEYNLAGGLISSQLVVCRPAFGEMTEEILDDYFIHRRLEKNLVG